MSLAPPSLKQGQKDTHRALREDKIVDRVRRPPFESAGICLLARSILQRFA
jgi:hypothetical protein